MAPPGLLPPCSASALTITESEVQGAASARCVSELTVCRSGMMRNRGSGLSIFSLQARPANTKMALVGFLVRLRIRDNSCYQKRILANPGFGKVCSTTSTDDVSTRVRERLMLMASGNLDTLQTMSVGLSRHLYKGWQLHPFRSYILTTSSQSSSPSPTFTLAFALFLLDRRPATF